MYDNPEIQNTHIKCTKVCLKFPSCFFRREEREREKWNLKILFILAGVPNKNIVKNLEKLH